MFKFVCTSCGKQLSQESVLFDLLDMVSGDYKFNEVKLRVTGAELRELLPDGKINTPDILECRIPFEKWKKLMANSNNYNYSEFGKISKEGIEELAGRELPSKVVKKEIDSTQYDEEELKKAVRQVEEDYKKQLEEEKKQKNRTKNIWLTQLVGPNEESQKNFATQLEKFLSMCNSELTLCLYLRCLLKQVGNTQEYILSGLEPYDSFGTLLKPTPTPRCCNNPRCRQPVFDGAGTAPQKTVVFIGSQRTGKTSAILAGSHYLLKAKNGGKQSEIWVGADPIPAKNVENATVIGRFKDELEIFAEGFAPEKTKALRAGKNVKDGKAAYSATLEITNENGVRSYLSMMDVPGEICDDEEDEINVDMIENAYQVIYTSDAFVLCFEDPQARYDRRKREAESEREALRKRNESNNEKVPIKTDEEIEKFASSELIPKRVCGWAKQIQERRRSRMGENTNYVPMLLMFTKCRDLEAPPENPQGLPVDDSKSKHYLLHKEQKVLSDDDFFKDILEIISTDDRMNGAYRASLRCSPYGEAVSQKRDGRSAKMPSPKNVDKLMKWILYATGCVPVKLESYGLSNSSCYSKVPENRYYLPDEMYLGKMIDTKDVENNKWYIKLLWRLLGIFPPYMGIAMDCYKDEGTRNRVAQIAMTRCILFENVRSHERAYTQTYRNKSRFCDAIVEAHKSRDRGEEKMKIPDFGRS